MGAYRSATWPAPFITPSSATPTPGIRTPTSVPLLPSTASGRLGAEWPKCAVYHLIGLETSAAVISRSNQYTHFGR